MRNFAGRGKPNFDTNSFVATLIFILDVVALVIAAITVIDIVDPKRIKYSLPNIMSRSGEMWLSCGLHRQPEQWRQLSIPWKTVGHVKHPSSF